ncbi:MAG: chemotaxis protein CheX [Gemmatimonadaceae bacterium]|jgi:CheY-specific phosphatase CheX|nr:chemotaxis protein CheX [Gemmatimonadaceae bacterium]
MPTSTTSPLWQATAQTFEELALLFPDATLTERQARAPLALTAIVEFTGPMRGRLVLRVSAEVLPSAAANMLGEDDAQHAPLQRDAVGELANVICGNVLPAVAGAEAVFLLSAPRLETGDVVPVREADRAMAQHAAVEVGVEDGRAVVDLWIVEGADALLVPLAA